MKIRLDHVTNSSSSGFIVSLAKSEVDDFRDYIHELEKHEDAQNEGVNLYLLTDSKKELDEYTNRGPIDWAQKPTGPRFERMDQKHYEMCLEVIKHGGTAVDVWIDHNVSEKFSDDYGDNILDNFM